MTLRKFFIGRTIGFLVVLILVGGFFLTQRIFFPQTPLIDSSSQTYSSDVYGISFTYPKNYVLNEIEAPGSGMRKHHIINLMRSEDLPAPVGGEGPQSITVEIYQNNLDNQTTENWIRNTSESNFKLSDGNLASTTLSNFPALSYRWSGLYEGTTIVTALPSWVYVATVTYLEMGSPIIQDFVQVRDSIRIAQ